MFIYSVEQDIKVNFVIIISSTSLYLPLHKCLVFSKTRLLSQSTCNPIHTECIKRPERGEWGWLALLFFHVGGDEVAGCSPKVIRRDFRALGQLVRESRAQVVFSSLIPIAGDDIARHRRTQSINTWLLWNTPRETRGVPLWRWHGQQPRWSVSTWTRAAWEMNRKNWKQPCY